MILDFHGFRQTQTAISVYYFVHEGFRFDYITPVLGPPWSIPMEFPLYQWIVAFVVLMTKSAIDQAGRLVSVLFFYACLIPIYLLSREYIKKKSYSLIILSMVLINPVYIFWTRTFMIESTALFLSLSYLYLFTKALEKEKWRYPVLAIIVGSLAGLTKITTFAVFLIAVFIIYCYMFNQKVVNYSNKDILLKYIITGALLALVPVLISYAWVQFGDSLKVDHPYASFLTSSSLKTWNWGSWEQKVSLATWEKIFNLSSFYQSFSLFCKVNSIILHLITFIILFLVSKRKTLVGSLLLIYISAPLIFTNLYYVHYYYQYANTVFFCFAIGFICISIIDSKNKIYSSVGTYLILPLILLFYIDGYSSFYYRAQTAPDHLYKPFKELTSFLKVNTKPDDIIIFDGFDWDSRYAYYSERKALMTRTRGLNTGEFNNSLERIKSDNLNIGAVVFKKYPDINQQIKYAAALQKDWNTTRMYGPVMLFQNK